MRFNLKTSSNVYAKLFLFLLCFPLACYSDKLLPTNTEAKEYLTTDKSMRCVQRTISKTTNKKAIFNCIRSGKEIFSINKWSEDIYFSDNNEYILGLSNTAIYQNAFWIVNQEGKIITEADFFSNEGKTNIVIQGAIFCELSMLVKAKWYNKENPSPKFIVNDGKLLDVKINSCSNQELSLNSFSKFKNNKSKTKKFKTAKD